MKHMTLLEATGYVTADHGEFAEASARTTAYPENRLDSRALLLGGVAFAGGGGRHRAAACGC